MFLGDLGEVGNTGICVETHFSAGNTVEFSEKV